MDACFSSGDAILLGLKLRILKTQYSADGDPDVTEWRILSEILTLSPLLENFCPRFRVDPDAHVKGNHRFRRFIAIDHKKRHKLAQASMTVFQCLPSSRQLSETGADPR